MKHLFHPTILREYDIRGQIDKNLSEKDAYALGRAFANYVRQECPEKDTPKVCVGYDGRITSPKLSEQLIDGLLQGGIHVIKIGLGPTPMLYFSVKHYEADAGVIVTGSHNPPDYNGFKMTLNKSPVFGDAIQTIGELAASGDLYEGQGHLEERDIKQIYVDRLIHDLALTRDMTVAWDAGNGAAGEILQLLVEKIPGAHHLLYENIDGTFPNHHPDPTVDDNLIDLQKLVTEKQCDLGIAFDGDGDRIGVVDEKGTVLRCDMLMTIYAREVIKNNPGAYIIGDVKCSQVMFDEISNMGGTPIMWKTGHSLVKDKMRELNAPLAGELSGHIFFADKYYGFDDALYCAIRLLNELSNTKGGLSELTRHLPQLFNTPEIRIEVREEEKFNLVPQVLNSLKDNTNPDLSINDLDGIRVSTSDGWWLLRPSNTQDVLVARVESNSADGFARLKKMMDEEIKKLGYSLPC